MTVFHFSFYCQNQLIQNETINDNNDRTFLPKCWEVKVAKSQNLWFSFAKQCTKLVSHQLLNFKGKEHSFWTREDNEDNIWDLLTFNWENKQMLEIHKHLPSHFRGSFKVEIEIICEIIQHFLGKTCCMIFVFSLFTLKLVKEWVAKSQFFFEYLQIHKSNWSWF